MSGWYRMKRGWQDNPLFARDEYSKRDAWVWMIEQAAWKPTRAKAGGSIIALERGQFTASIRYMAEAWGWHRAKCERFISALKTETMIETRTETGQLVITVCNYELYQGSLDEGETPDETAAESLARQQRDTDESKTETPTETPAETALTLESHYKTIVSSVSPQSSETPAETAVETAARQPCSENETNIEERKNKNLSEPHSDTKPVRKQRVVKSLLPDDWVPGPFGEGTQSRAIVDSWLPARKAEQLEAFRAHHRAKGNMHADWQAAWSTWVLNSRRFGQPASNDQTSLFSAQPYRPRISEHAN